MSTGSIVNRAKLEAQAYRFAEQKARDLTIADCANKTAFSPVPVSVSNPYITTVQDQSCKSCTTFTTDLCIRIHIHDVTVELETSASEEPICRTIKAVRHA